MIKKMTPFVKWAGGKRQLLDKINELKPKKFGRYFEPFIGGGALLFDLVPNRFTINDTNKELICIYKCLRNKMMYQKMVMLCDEHEKNHSEEYYYQVRDLDRKRAFKTASSFVKAARCLYLNKACFNGLYRVNSKGYFNVPFNGKEKVHCFDKDNLESIHKYFIKRKPVILCKDFEKAVATAKKNDFVYFDPPYDVVADQSFTSYTSDGFGKEEQKRLAKVFKELSNKGVFVMLSNANTTFIQELYKDFNIHIVNANRRINSKAEGRGNVEEVIITNY